MSDLTSIADYMSGDGGRPYADAIADHMQKIMTDLALAESRDIRAALAAWSDIPGIDDPANLIRISYDGDGIKVGTGSNGSLFERSKPTVHLEVPKLIVIADKRHAANDRGPVSVDWRRHERTYTGERYIVALLHCDEAAKIPRQVHTATEPVNYQPEMDD